MEHNHGYIYKSETIFCILYEILVVANANPLEHVELVKYDREM